MSIVKSSQPPPESSSTGGISCHQTSNDKHLSKRDVRTIFTAAGGGLLSLFLIAWLLLPLSSKILPFVLVSAWPLLTLIVVAYQAVVYRRQWNVMQDNLDQTEQIVGKMQSQLDGIDRQAKAMEDSVLESRKLVEHSEKAAKDQLLALQGQWQAMDLTLEEQRKLFAQNERAVKAAERNAELAEASEAPYFGIIGIRAADFALGYYTGVDITFFNGGKTPAWHFFPLAHFIVGEHPDYPEAKHPLELITTDIASTFFATETAHVFEFRQSKFALTEDIVSEKKGLFLIVTADYLGRGGISKGYIRQNFICLWEKGKFCDWLPADNSPQYSNAD